VDQSESTFADDGAYGGIIPNSGSYMALLGASGVPGSLSQTLSTVPGQPYTISLWLDSPDGKTPNSFSVTWNGNTLYNQTNLPATGWENLQFNVTASASTSVLQFGFRNDPSSFGLDGISVVPLAIARPQLTAVHSGTNFVLTWPDSFSGYTLQCATNITGSVNWTNVTTTPLDIGGQMTITRDLTPKQLYFRLVQ
jgi:hypothetical protein